MPNITNLTALVEKTDSKLVWVNWVSFYGLLSFFREYIPAFANLFELLHQFLGQGTQPWMLAAGEYICKRAWQIITALCWLNVGLSAKLRIDTRVSNQGIAALLFQYHLDKL